MEPLINAKDLAEMFKLNRQTIYRLTRQGKIPYIKVAGSIRYNKETINKWLERKIKA